ncbi:hypothetical protein DRO33_02360 [Candidatus Bathyarchaeota archaeon]|nr:MAG: hypothetical protein DRO33_02360 [Candidatus Bathyarchaeota archaeon]
MYVVHAASSALLAFSSSAVLARYVAELVGPETEAIGLTGLDGLLLTGALSALAVPYDLAVLAGPLPTLLVALIEAVVCLFLLLI